MQCGLFITFLLLLRVFLHFLANISKYPNSFSFFFSPSFCFPSTEQSAEDNFYDMPQPICFCFPHCLRQILPFSCSSLLLISICLPFLLLHSSYNQFQNYPNIFFLLFNCPCGFESWTHFILSI